MSEEPSMEQLEQEAAARVLASPSRHAGEAAMLALERQRRREPMPNRLRDLAFWLPALHPARTTEASRLLREAAERLEALEGEAG